MTQPTTVKAPQEGAKERKKITIPTLYEMKANKEPITWLTAYDYPTALIMDRAGIEMILVGDSAGMTMLGYPTTLPVTMDQMITFTAAVCRAAKYAFVVGDMPYMSYQVSTTEAVRNAGRFMSECGADCVKLEGGERMAPTIRAITDAGVPVMGHIGLTPQSASQLGGYKAQGRTAEAAKAIIHDAECLQDAGAFAILLECIPCEVAGIVTEKSKVPILSLGSGDRCDGQLMIVHDMLGFFEKFTPKFVKKYANLSAIELEAFTAYRDDVKSGDFPKPEHFYAMAAGEAEKLEAAV